MCVSIGSHAILLYFPTEMVADAPPESFVGYCLEYLDGENILSCIYKMRKTRKKKVRFAKKLTKTHYIRKSYYKRGGGLKKTLRRLKRRKKRKYKIKSRKRQIVFSEEKQQQIEKQFKKQQKKKRRAAEELRTKRAAEKLRARRAAEKIRCRHRRADFIPLVDRRRAISEPLLGGIDVAILEDDEDDEFY